MFGLRRRFYNRLTMFRRAKKRLNNEADTLRHVENLSKLLQKLFYART